MYIFSASVMLICLSVSASVSAGSNVSTDTGTSTSAAQPPATADTAESYRYLRTLRSDGQHLLQKDAKPADLKQALEKFQAALDYLATQPVAERANGNQSMRAEHINLLLPMAQAYAQLGMKEQALTALEKLSRQIWLPALAQELASPAFDSVRAEPRFQAVLQTMTLPQRVYGTKAIATPYKPVLSTEEKVAGLSLFWSEARRNFVHFDHVPELDWTQVYMNYLTKVIAAPTTRDYYQVMMQLAPLLKDGHTNIYPPEQLVNTFYARPPIRTSMIEDRVVIEEISAAGLAAHVQVGEEIVSIDGEAVKQYAEQRVAPYVSASTPQDWVQRTYGYQLLAGDAAKPLRLRLRAADGAEREEVLQRGGKFQGREPFEFRMLPGQIAYLALGEFESADGVKLLEQHLPEILQSSGLVLDVRRNGGGGTGNGLAVLSYLSREPITGSAEYVRAEDAYMLAQGMPVVLWQPPMNSGQAYSVRRKEVYAGPVAVLTSARTFSAAEDFAVAFRGMKRGVIVGQASGGSTGQPEMIDLPGGGKGRICIKRDTYPDQTPFVGVGVLPDVEAHPTVASVRAGRDPVLERALVELGKR